MAIFKDYNGNPIIFDHVHVVEDTVNSSGSTAIATTSEDGFISNTDMTNLDNLETQILDMSDKIKQALYIKQYTQEEINLTFVDSTSNLMTMVYLMNFTDVQVSNEIVANVKADAIGTLTYKWNASRIYTGPDGSYNDVLGTGYFSDVTGNTISASYLTNLVNKSFQPYSEMRGTVTITNSLQDKTSTITKNFNIYFFQM